MTISGPTTRSESDTLLYLVNYTDNQGFAILGANPAVMDIYAISPSGQLTVQDFNDNPILADFLDDAIAYASDFTGPVIDPVQFTYRYTVTDKQMPLLDPMASAWTQENPYNTETFDKNGFMCPVGCVNLSFGMVLSFYQKPRYEDYSWNNKSIKKFNFDWPLMLASPKKNNSDQKVAEMFGFLGSPDLLDIAYDTVGSGGDKQHMTQAITALGGGNWYLCNDSLTNDIDSIAAFILHGRLRLGLLRSHKFKAAPVISCSVALNQNEAGQHNKHAWVIDGVALRERYAVDSKGQPMFHNLDGSIKYEKVWPLWHCVWGFSNKQVDGWYLYLKEGNVLDTTQYTPFDPKGPMWPTGVRMTTKYANWSVFGGCFPEVIEFKPGPIITLDD